MELLITFAVIVLIVVGVAWFVTRDVTEVDYDDNEDLTQATDYLRRGDTES